MSFLKKLIIFWPSLLVDYLSFFCDLRHELILGTRIRSADVKRKTLITSNGETISYKIPIIETGARALNANPDDLIFMFERIASCLMKHHTFKLCRTELFALNS